MQTEIISYRLKDLAELEGHHPNTIKNSNRYLKIRIETWWSNAQFKLWATKSPYTYRYIRLEDIQKALKNKVDFNFITK